MPCNCDGMGDYYRDLAWKQKCDSLAEMLCRTLGMFNGEPIWECIPDDIKGWYEAHLVADEMRKAGK